MAYGGSATFFKKKAPTSQWSNGGSWQPEVAPLPPGSPTLSNGSTWQPEIQPQATPTQPARPPVWIGGQGPGAYSPNTTFSQSTRPRPTGGITWTAGPGAAKPTGELTGPGAYEQWYGESKGAFSKPTHLSGYLEGLMGKIGGMKFQPTNTRGAYGYVESLFRDPSQGVTGARDASGRLLSGPTMGEDTMTTAAGYFGGPNLAHGYATDTADFFRTPGRSEAYADQYSGQLNRTGMGEEFAADNLPGLRNAGAAERNLATADNALSFVNYGKQGYEYAGENIGDASRTQGYADELVPWSRENITGDEFDFYRPLLREKSHSENLYESGNGGLNVFYDRERDKRTKRLQDEMAAMGLFTSGATGRGMAEIEGELGAQQARDMADLARQADDQRLGRIGQAESFAANAGQETLARRGLGLQGVTAADEGIRSNINTIVGAGEVASREALEKVGLRTDAATAAQDAELRRIFGAGNLAVQGQQLGQDRLRLGSDIANAADNNALARALGGSTVANTGDTSIFNQGEGLGNIGKGLADTEITRTETGANLGLAADLEERLRASGLVDAASTLDAYESEAVQLGITLEQLLADVTGSVDEQDWARFIAEGEAAGSAQDYFEGRKQQEFDNTFKVGQAKSGLYADGSSQATGESGMYEAEGINLLIAQGGLEKQQAEQRWQELLQQFGGALQAYEYLKKGGK